MPEAPPTSGETAAHAIELKLSAVAENTMLIRQALGGAAKALGADDEVVEDVKLAVTEASSNAIKYAYNGAPGPLSITLDPVDEGLAVTVTDSGHWHEPEFDEQPGGGLGLPLMGSLARQFDVSTGARGTTIRLEFGLEREPQDPGESE